MCTKKEVEDVVQAAVMSSGNKKLLTFFGGVSMLFIAWLTYEVHMQPANVLTMISDSEKAQTVERSSIMSKLDNLHRINATTMVEIAGRIERLSDQILHIKERALDRSSDRYTGKEARARNDLVDERCKTVDRRLKEIEDTVERLHKNENI